MTAVTSTDGSPATEEVVQTVALAAVGQADAAIDRAAAAQETWRAVAPADRARLLRRFAEAVDGDLENLARLEVANAGHTIGNARWEAGNVRDVLHYYAAAPERLCGRQIPVAGGIDVTFKESLGVVGVIVPWNFPMPIAGWGFEPALAAGNSVVLKPAELTPLTAIRLGELAFANSPRWARSFRPGSGPSSRHTSPVTRRSPSAASARAAPGTGIRRPCSRRRTPTRGSGARGVESGNLSVNSHSSVRYHTPFSGFKQSGLGRELGPDTVDAFTETKNLFTTTDI